MSDDISQGHEDRLLSAAEALAEELHYIGAYRKAIGRESKPAKPGARELASLEQCRQALHDAGAAALCLSGGGIRSATFNLGVLQGLAKFGLLHRFDYLSTVSGGGYVGGWLAAWAFRAGSIAKVETALGGAPAIGPGLDAKASAPPVDWLRDYSNYLAPKTGLMSADTWTLVATYVRNLLVVWMAIIPPLMLLLYVPRLYEHYLGAENYGSLERLWSTTGLAALSVILLWVGETYSYILKEDEGGQGKASTYILSVNVIYTLGAIALAFAWIVSPKSGAAASIVPLFAFVMVLGVTWIGIRREWQAPAGKGWSGALEANHDSIVACLVQALVMTVTLSMFLTITWRMALTRTDWPFVLYPILLLCAMGAGDLFYAAFLSWRATDVDRERWARSAAWFAIFGLGWIAWTWLALLAPSALWGGDLAHGQGQALVLPHALDAALALVLGAVLARMGLRPQAREGTAATGARAQAVLLALAMLLFVVLVAAMISSANVWLEQAVRRGGGDLANTMLARWLGAETLEKLRVGAIGIGAPGILLFACYLVLRGININGFSLHAMYRDRLIRAYLGATRSADADEERFAKMPDGYSWFADHGYRKRWMAQALRRTDNPYTGFDGADNPDLFWLGVHQTQPLWVVSMALNLAGSEEHLSWQERKAASFTASPLHCGSATLTGYRRTCWYGGPDGGMTAGTAMAVSGAAANPNMGYLSSPTLTFLMTFFNVRLGWWLGNPNPARDAGRNLHRERSPRYGLFQLLAELFGRTDAKADWIHLSDGGHFENLGLYEMVLRRCKYIVVCDASADPERAFEDLGNAIRKIRIDLGVEIEPLDPDARPVGPRSRQKGAGHALFRICYGKERGEGKLLYIKPSVYDDDAQLPRDVRQYASVSPSFPHESTVDQFFGESQFESYRALGKYQLVEGVLRGLGHAAPLEAAFERARANAKKRAARASPDAPFDVGGRYRRSL